MRPPFSVLPLLVMVMAGCVSVESVNMQRCGLRSAGDFSVTVMLDLTAVADVPELQKRVTTFLDDVAQFATTGEIASLTRAELTGRLLAKVSPEYGPWVQGAITATLSSLDTRATIGNRNQRRILAYLHGSRQAVAHYAIEDRAGARARAKVRPLPANGVPPWPEAR